MTPRQTIIQEIEAIAARHHVPMRELMGHSRHKYIVAARHAAYFHVWHHHGWSLPKTGTFFGRDPTTIAHGIGRHMARNKILVSRGGWMAKRYVAKLVKGREAQAEARIAA